MAIQELIQQARQGTWEPVHVLVGSARFLVERAVAALRQATVGDGPGGFNDDVFHGQGLAAATVSSAARTLPMMAQARFVLVRNAEAMSAQELDRLTDYVADPAPSTCLVLVADKLDGRTRFAKAAKKRDAWVEAQPPKGPAVRTFAIGEAKSRGHRLPPDAADALVAATGDDLAAIDDALERLSLFVGEGEPIDLQAVEACVTRVRTESIWTLVDAVSLRDERRALRAAASMLDAREPPLRILAMVARQLRLVARMRQGLASGLQPPQAAKQAGIPGFKAREMAEAARRFTARDLKHAFGVLADTDRALKSSKRPGDVILEESLLQLCDSPPTARPTR